MVISTPKEAGPERESRYWSNGHLGGCQHYQFPPAPPISGRKDNVLGVKGSLVSGLLHVAHLLRLLLEGGQFGAWLTVKMCVWKRLQEAQEMRWPSRRGLGLGACQVNI